MTPLCHLSIRAVQAVDRRMIRQVTGLRYRRQMEMRNYPDMAAVLRDDETGLITLWQAHTAVRCRCAKDGGCEARQVLEDAIDRIRLLRAAAGLGFSPG